MDTGGPTSPEPMATQQNSNEEKSAKQPVIRGARACTVCRNAKMRCIGGDDQASHIRPCNRCKKANVECIFEKHRRGRKPGSKLSDASKLLRRRERELHTASNPGSGDASSSQAAFAVSPSSRTDEDVKYTPPVQQHPNGYMDAAVPPRPHALNMPPNSTYLNGPPPPAPSRASTSAVDFSRNPNYPEPYRSEFRSPVAPPFEEEEQDDLRNEENLYPQNMLAKERKQQTYFDTVLTKPSSNAAGSRVSVNSRDQDVKPRVETDVSSSSKSPAYTRTQSTPWEDPVTTGLVTQQEAQNLFESFFLRLNPFINLFDSQLHTVEYVQSRSPFLFSCMMMACTKFFMPKAFKLCQKMALDYAGRAFIEQWKSVEVVQAFCCLVYWKDPEDTRTWMYIGYACRMAIELGLNRFHERPPPNESDFARLHRRNHERTYLVLFVHDRSLSMQTGRMWMLPEDELVRNSGNWHKEDKYTRSEDVIVAAFVQLRRLAAEISDVFYLHRGSAGERHTDVNYDILLSGCNSKLTEWSKVWHNEMNKVTQTTFPHAMLRYFRLHVRLFLNSLGFQFSLMSTAAAGRGMPSLQALSVCYGSAVEALDIVIKEFRGLKVLCYGQDVISVMSAYAALYLLKILDRTASLQHRPSEIKTKTVHDLILQTADAYEGAILRDLENSSALSHSRFMRNLVTRHLEMHKPAAQDAGRFDSMQGSHTEMEGVTSGHETETLGSKFSPRGGMPQPSFPNLQQHRQSQSFPNGHATNGSGMALAIQTAGPGVRQPIAPSHSAHQSMEGIYPSPSGMVSTPLSAHAPGMANQQQQSPLQGQSQNHPAPQRVSVPNPYFTSNGLTPDQLQPGVHARNDANDPRQQQHQMQALSVYAQASPVEGFMPHYPQQQQPQPQPQPQQQQQTQQQHQAMGYADSQSMPQLLQHKAPADQQYTNALYQELVGIINTDAAHSHMPYDAQIQQGMAFGLHGMGS